MIAAPARPALVVAGAGAGKTETMAARVVWLVAIGAVLPEQVLGLTFTRKAAQQLGARVRSRLRRLAGSRLLDELDPSGERRSRAARGRADRRHLPRLRRTARRRARPAAARRARRPAAGGDGVVAARAPGGQHLGRRAGRRRACPPRSPTGCWRWPVSWASTSSSPHAVRAHAERLAAVLEAAPRGKGQRAEPSQTYQRWIGAAAQAASRCCRWWRRSSRGSGPSAPSTSPTSSPSPRGSPTPTPRSGRPSAPPTGRCCSTSTRTPGTRSGCCCARCSARGRASRCARTVRRSRRSATPASRSTAGAGPARATWPASAPISRPLTTSRAGPADQYGLLTSFRNPPEVLRLANTASAALRGAGVEVGELRPGPQAAEGVVRVALLPDVATEVDWMADPIAEQWQREGPSPTSAVLVRRRVDMDAIAAALRARGLPVEVVGLGGLLGHPRGSRPGECAAAGRRPARRARRRPPPHRCALAAGRRRSGRALGPGP